MSIDLPKIQVNCENKDIEQVINYIHQYWKQLIVKSPPFTKEELFYLPYPYVVPGGVFQQLFYWDSYFTILGLKVSKLHNLARGIVDDFLYEMDIYGIIPNSSETAHLSRSQPPFLSSMIKEVLYDDHEWLRSAYQKAIREYEYVWMDPNTHYHTATGLNKYYDDIEKMLKVKGEAYLHFDKLTIPSQFFQERTEAESGWDYTGRFHRECGFFIPVDLNSLLYKYEIDFSDFALILGYEDEAHSWKQRASRRKKLMDMYLWNHTLGMYLDFNFMNQKQYVYPSLATFFPLWAGVASSEQAERVKNNIPTFLHKGGMVTSSYHTGFQWDAPNGWAPLQWIVIDGLRKYRFKKESFEIANRWISLCTNMFRQHGKLYEKYNVVDFNINTTGRYPLQEGFGWTNAIYNKVAVDLLECKIE